MQSDHREPLNLGTDRMVTINQLAEIIRVISGKRDIRIRHIDGPQGVRGRNSDNTRLREVLGWEPAIDLEEGLVGTYRWIESRVRRERTPSWRRRRRSRDRGRPGAADPARRHPRGPGQRGRHDPGARRDRALDRRGRATLRVRHGRARRDGVAARPRAASDPQRVRAHDARRDADGLARAPRRRHLDGARVRARPDAGPRGARRRARLVELLLRRQGGRRGPARGPAPGALPGLPRRRDLRRRPSGR